MTNGFQYQFIEQILAPNVGAISKRQSIYRNNVFVGLVDNIISRFPATRRATGEAFFDALARDYADAVKPTSPLMMLYGQSFPEFIDSIPALAPYPWLSDVARLEYAMSQSFHAADAPCLTAEAFSALQPHQLETLIIHLHPACAIVVSSYPLVSLWHMALGKIPAGAIDDLPAQAALITRPYVQVQLRSIDPMGAVFLQQIQKGTLGLALEHAMSIDANFDLTPHLSLIIEHGLACDLSHAI